MIIANPGPRVLRLAAGCVAPTRRADRGREAGTLSAKAQAGTPDADEQDEIDNGERVGHILSLMKWKACRSLAEWDWGLIRHASSSDFPSLPDCGKI